MCLLFFCSFAYLHDIHIRQYRSSSRGGTFNVRPNCLLVVRTGLSIHMNITWQPKLSIEPNKKRRETSINFGLLLKFMIGKTVQSYYIYRLPPFLRILFYFSFLFSFFVFCDCIPGFTFLFHSNQSITLICMDVL